MIMTKKVKKNKNIIKKVFEDCKMVSGCSELRKGIYTGFYDLDYMTQGLQGGNLILLAGRSFMGKTAFALSVSRHVILKERKPVVYFSPGRSEKQIMARLLSMDSEVKIQDMLYGNFDKDRWIRLNDSAKRIAESPLYIDDSACITVDEIRKSCLEFKRRNELGLVFLDSLQFVVPDSRWRYGSEDKKKQSIMRGLKKIAVEMDCPVIVISKLREPTNLDDNKRPEITDLDGSDYSAQYSDTIIFMYQDRSLRKSLQTTDILTDLIIAKNRSGKDGVVKLKPQFEYSRFVNVM